MSIIGHHWAQNPAQTAQRAAPRIGVDPWSFLPPTSRATGGCTDSATQMLDSSCAAVLSAAVIFATLHARNHGGWVEVHQPSLFWVTLK
jgi:hypothetical protein